VKDVLKVIFWMAKRMTNQDNTDDSIVWNEQLNGIYNLGTGKARSFIDLVNATFKGLDLNPAIEFIDMPLDIREKYQYFTEASMNKLYNAGYHEPFYALESGVDDYVRNYLAVSKQF
jgi:ADP-L-glycero-D-manno-heptose 6-epimerase